MTASAVPDGFELPASRPAPGMLGLAERGLLPDAVIRAGIRRLCSLRLRGDRERGVEATSLAFQRGIAQLRSSAIAIHVDAANQQHYELPAEFFRRCLGPRLKYSACWFEHDDDTLAQAESAMLGLYGARAELENGQDILELGCGWGSLTLWMAERYPNSRITAVSNSHSQRAYIEQVCRDRGLTNVKVITRDVNDLEFEAAAYDRCVSVEMFEHLRNYELLLARIGDWLRPGGALFVHIFCHRTLMYPFETVGEDNWMGRHFFTGGLMPAADTLLWFQDTLRLEDRWLIDGRHYQRTADCWLQNQDSHRDALAPLLRATYGSAAELWTQRWRMFWMACSELFGYAEGREWGVAHYRMRRRS